MEAPLLNNAPYTIHDGDMSGEISSSASPEESALDSPGRYDDHDKRKFDQVDSNLKSPASKHSHTIAQDSYDEDDDNDRPRKPGRKPMANTPTPTSVDPKQKRKAQNRAAQRAFRERKEKYVKELEDRIAELEASQGNQSVTLEKENQQLKELVQKLEAENYLLKGTAFTFDFPISKANVNKPTTALVPEAGVQPSTLMRHDGVVPTSTDAWTPPSSAHDDSGSEPSSPSGLTSSPSTVKTTTQTTPSADPLADVTGLNNGTAFTGFGDLSAETLDSFFDNTAAFETSAADRFMANHVPHMNAEDIENSSLFSQYRTPASIIENSTFSETPMPPLFENDFDDYGSFAPIMTPKEEQFRPSDFLNYGADGKLGSLSPIQQHDAKDAKGEESRLTPVQAWELIQKHPQFDEIEIEDLCDELKNKATCSSTFTEDEVHSVIEKKINRH